MNKTKEPVKQTGYGIPGLSEMLKQDPVIHIIASDPGPASSAYVAVCIDSRTDAVEICDAAYVLNSEATELAMFDSFLRQYLPNVSFAYESCSCYGRVIGATVFDTAAEGGEMRGWYKGITPIYAVKSPEWRRSLTGFNNANDSLVRQCLQEYFQPTGGGKDPYKGIKSQPGPWEKLVQAGAKAPGGSKMPHLLDAVGVAVGLYKMSETANMDPEALRLY